MYAKSVAQQFSYSIDKLLPYHGDLFTNGGSCSFLMTASTEPLGQSSDIDAALVRGAKSHLGGAAFEFLEEEYDLDILD